MKKVFLLATVSVATLCFSACKKDKDSISNNSLPEKKLSKITKKENGITTVYNLTYSTAGKLVSIVSTDKKDSTNFAYDASGNLTAIYKQDQEIKSMYAFQYNNNKPETGSYKSWDISMGVPGRLVQNDHFTYTVTNNQVSGIHMVMMDASEADIALTYTNGNLTRLNHNGFISYIGELSYGTRKAIYPKLTSFVLDPMGYTVLYSASHEVLKVLFDFPGSTHDFEINTTYTYDSNGYVLSSNDGDIEEFYEYR